MSQEVLQSIVEIIKVLLNPWTVLFFVIFTIFRSEISLVLKGLSSLTGRVSEMSFNDVKFQLLPKQEVIRNLQEETKNLGEEHDENSILSLINTLLNKTTDSDLITFKELFNNTDSLVIERGSKYEGALYRFLEAGVVNTSETPLAFAKKKAYVQEWSITRLGKILLRNI